MTVNYECIPIDDIIAALERDDMTGFCLSCHAESQGAEPDAINYPCESVSYTHLTLPTKRIV